MHPITGEPVQFAFSTLERWLHLARKAAGHGDTVGALRRKDPLGRRDAARGVVGGGGRDRRAAQGSPDVELQAARRQPGRAGELGELAGRVPSYTTVRRTMKERGLFRQKRRQAPRQRRPRGPRPQPGDLRGARDAQLRERVRPRAVAPGLPRRQVVRIVLADGEVVTPKLLGMLDDRSRLCCHAQWYLDESAEDLVHGLVAGDPEARAAAQLMTDNGSAMKAAEVREGLARLGILHEHDAAGSPSRTASRRLLGQRRGSAARDAGERRRTLTLDVLNEATQAWVELEYNRARHSEIGEAPAERFLRGPDVGRPSPSAEELRLAFRVEETRHAAAERRHGRRIDGVRFEVPSRYRTPGAAERPLRVAGTCRRSTSSTSERRGARAAVPARPHARTARQSRRLLAEVARTAHRRRRRVAGDDPRDGAAAAPAHHRVRPRGAAAGVPAQGRQTR